MGFKDQREWLSKLESEGELNRIDVEVDWEWEIGAIANLAFQKGFSGLLFGNIKGYQNARCRKLFTGGLINDRQIALMFGLPKDTHRSELAKVCRERFRQSVKPTTVTTGPVKENILRGGDVNLYDFPVPKWSRLDGGRYINTFCGIVTRDPETGIQNVGLYRGMITDKDKIAMPIPPPQHIGLQFSKYQRLGRDMPVAVVYGWDPCLPFVASSGIPLGICEYDVMGSVRREPVELVKCETSALEVPAFAEIVVEGSVSPDTETYEWEGPFAEFTGYYAGEKEKKPVIKVACVTHRNDPVFTGTSMAMGPGHPTENANITNMSLTALLWETIERSGVPGLLDVRVLPGSAVTNVVLKIHKTYRGQGKQIALAVFGSGLPKWQCKNIMVVDDDIDIYDFESLEWAVAHRVNPMEYSVVVIPFLPGTILDPSVSPEQRDNTKFGGGIAHRVIIDATKNWNFGRRKEWGDDFYPPVSFELSAQDKQMVGNRWKEYGLEKV